MSVCQPLIHFSTSSKNRYLFFHDFTTLMVGCGELVAQSRMTIKA